MSSELKAAKIIATARHANTTLDPLPPMCRPKDLNEAYNIQEIIHNDWGEDRMGERIGYKIGCTTAVMQKNLGITHPCAGSIKKRDVQYLSAVLPIQDFIMPGVECEIGVVLDSDLRPEDGPFNLGKTAKLIGSVFAAIELVDNRYRGATKIGVPTLISDDFFGAGAILGEFVNDWAAIDLAKVEGHLFINGDLQHSGFGASVMGHPLEAVSWFLNMKARRAEIVKAGEFILTGSLTPVQWIATPCKVAVKIDQLGEVEVIFN
tara:strand:- start:3054 stop:3842 length:789 start_codon:yes stop_codon:yes gene_type:complete